MNSRGRVIKLFSAACFWLLLVNVGSLRCEPPATELSTSQPQVRKSEGWFARGGDEEGVKDEKSQRFQELEWIIKQVLNNKYQRLEVQVEPEDGLD